MDANGFATKITVVPGSTPRSDNGDTPEPASLVWQYVYSGCTSCGQPTHIITPSGLTADMTYDSYGNMTSWTSKNPSGTGTVTYGWTWYGPEKENRPMSYVPPGGAATINYSYGTWLARTDTEGGELWGYMPSYFHMETTPISVEGGGNHILTRHIDLDATGRSASSMHGSPIFLASEPATGTPALRHRACNATAPPGT